MEKNMPEREDFEDAIVQPVDGVIVQGDDEEIKLLFFYLNTRIKSRRGWYYTV
jgi:hypothetical protein